MAWIPYSSNTVSLFSTLASPWKRGLHISSDISSLTKETQHYSDIEQTNVAFYVDFIIHACFVWLCSTSLLDWEHRISSLELEIDVISTSNVTLRALIQPRYKSTIILTRTWWSSFIDGLVCIRRRQFRCPGSGILIRILSPHPTSLRPFHR